MIIALMNRQFNANWLDINLTSEIDEFHKNTDVNALNKVMLLDKVGAYRYLIKYLFTIFVIKLMKLKLVDVL